MTLRYSGEARVSFHIDENVKLSLVQAADAALDLAYSPYSDNKVGAALLCTSGKIWTGGNVGNACSTLNCCAEQTCSIQAVMAKDYPFVAIAIVQKSGRHCLPCGRCLQLLSEFASDMAIITREHGEIKVWPLSYLLPQPFIRS
jgi:homotetrameric cytidine deaminase